jgi:hypothetical protein
MKYRHLVKIMKNPLLLILTIFTIVYEIKTHSAYDFTSDEFKQRLLLVEMMEY